MQVILLQDVKGLGRKMEVREVHDGYARNFLFPKKLAALADEKNLAQRAKLEAGRGVTLRALEEQAKKLGATTLTFGVKTGERGEVFASITKEQIKKTLIAEGFHVMDVLLPKPIRALGTHRVDVKLGEGFHAEVPVEVTPER
jgi:large subunit ribosomal protein L9